jgi:hypothetical protein
MIPLESAFRVAEREAQRDLRERGGEQALSGELSAISRTAAMVTDDLILVVLNGQIISAKRDAAEFMPVLDEIRNIGTQTKAVFDDSIADLHDTVLSSLLSDAQFQAFLAVDIMDRNLYERANDVRWWALTTRFRELMAKPARDAEENRTLGAVLGYINGLYTVYTNLVLYDARGSIVAVSNPQQAHQVGRSLAEEPAVQAALRLSDSQRYTVSPFVPTPLYDNRPTYVYHTSIRAPQGGGVVGGIGIVFDSEPEFRAMLADALPTDGEGRVLEGAFGLFAGRDGEVIASTDEQLAPGARIELDERLFALENGGRTSTLLRYRGRNYAVGAAMSQGYREYKTSGDYENDILALIFVPV